MRIIGGTHRSRPLQAPRGRATRPTSDRVREALFGILESAEVVANASVLDLYAGTGALGLEALSRGAARATFVESSRQALAALRANVAALGLGERSAIVAADVRAILGGLTGGFRYDLVFADPPWSLVDSGEASAVLAELARSGALSPAAWVILEHSARTGEPAAENAGLVAFDRRRYGDTALAFYKPDILRTPVLDR